MVRIIFEKYVYEGFGAQRLSRWLYNNGYLNRKGTNFANTTIIKMLKNIMYVGILRSGETRSEIFPELQIVPLDLYERAQELMEARTMHHNEMPFNSKGKALLSGMVYCAHCGSKLVLTTSSGRRAKGEPKRETPATTRSAILRTVTVRPDTPVRNWTALLIRSSSNSLSG